MSGIDYGDGDGGTARYRGGIRCERLCTAPMQPSVLEASNYDNMAVPRPRGGRCLL